ncbi:MAG: radical SAM protein [Bryobacteraceae bacterium]|jgi:MoaA/NifB/PqqE/SkfB family radical SAM enzyme
MTFDIEADWVLNQLCNYDCEYCADHSFTEHRLVGRISPQQYLDFFDSTGKTWLLHITGGEPFLYPDFVRLCQTLTSRHYISLNSNLSSPRVRDFAAQVDPSRVQFVHCAVHVEQRDRRKGWNSLQANLTALLERGFPLFASLVMTPAAFAGFPRVAESFTPLGVPLIPKSIRGAYEGRWYPQAYTETERAQFRRFSQQAERIAITSPAQPFRHHPTVNPLIDRDYLDGFPDFTGIPCSAGRTTLAIGYDGNIFRCGPKTLLGNIFERRLDLMAADRPCDDAFCGAYYCLRYSRFDREALADYPRQTAPNVFQQARIITRSLRRKIRNRLAESSYPPRP